jgi:hypothetical protein
MSTRISGCLLAVMLAIASHATAADAPARTSSPDGAAAYFISPANGAEVPPTFTIRFGLRGMGVAPAAVATPKTGHHHLLVDAAEIPPFDAPLPANEHVIHFGGGQTETEITLAPGTHTLQLVLGDALHVPHNPPVISDKITITVSEPR